MAMYTIKGIGEISTDAFDEKITLRNLLQHFSFYDFIIVDTKQNILFHADSPVVKIKIHSTKSLLFDGGRTKRGLADWSNE